MKWIVVSLFSLSVCFGFAQQKKKFSKLMVVSLAGNVQQRKTIEDEIMIQLRDANYDAVASNRLLSSELSVEKVKAKCDERNIDAVLLISTLNVRQPVEYEDTDKSPNITVVVWGPYNYSQGPWTAGANTKVTLLSSVIQVADGEVFSERRKNVFVGLNPEVALEKYAKSVVKSVKSVVNKKS